MTDLPYNTPYTDHFQRAQGNLQYLDFIDMVKEMWESAHPEPIVPSGGEQFAKYPSIVYSLQLRKAHPSEPKPKYRDEIITNPGEQGIIICGQRYQNIVNFTVVDDDSPRNAEELVEVFEDFMLEFTPIFKQMGLSEIVYARRLPDDDQPRVAENVNMRTVSYLVTTEKIIKTSYDKWHSMLVRARMAITQDVLFITSGDQFQISGASYPTGQTVTLAPLLGETFPEGNDGAGNTIRPNGTYHILSHVTGPNNQLLYNLSAAYDTAPLIITTPGSGRVSGTGTPTDSVDQEIRDDFQTPVP